MSGTCVACGGDVADDAARCPSCGLAFGGAPGGDPLGAGGAPAHVGLYLGTSPRLEGRPDEAAESAGVEREAPAAAPAVELPADRRRRRRRWAVGALIAAVAVTAGAVFVLSRRPNDEFTARENYFERFVGADGLEPAEPPAEIDVDAVVAQIGDAEVRRAATAAHRPFTDAERSSVHALFDGYLARLLEIQPDFAFRLGVHPHPVVPAERSDALRIRWMLLCRDTAHVLRAWPAAATPTAHDRTDRTALLDHVESSLRWEGAADLEGLDDLDRWVDPLVHLAQIPCCPASDRIAVATARLRETPARLDRMVTALRTPPHARVLASAAHLDEAGEYLKTYAAGWAAAPPGAVAELGAAIDRARDAVKTAAWRMRTEVARRATGASAVGAANVASLLRIRHHLPLDARTVYGDALDELRAAGDALRESRRHPRRNVPSRLREPIAAEIRELRGLCGLWISPQPADEGVAVAPLPSLWKSQGAGAAYLDPGTLAGPSAGVVHVGERTAARELFERDYDDIVLRHTLAHESYPGHRLQAVASRAACPLRRFIDDRVFIEGWAVYAEELIHETDGCVGGGPDDWARASRRQSNAAGTLCSLLAATVTVPESELLDLLRGCGWPEPTLEQAGAAAARGVYEIDYFLGGNEILRLRRREEARLGSAFDLRAFHAKLLAAGPISPRLIEEEWTAEGR